MIAKKKHDILVLNRAYVPLHIIEWHKGVSLIYKDSAHSLDRDFIAYNYKDWVKFSIANAEDYAKIKTINYQLAVPEIITLTNYDRLPDREVKYSRQNLHKVYKNTCCYCGKVLPSDELEVEHVIPRSRGGKSVWNNTVIACRPCNQKKGSQTPTEANMTLLVKPARPKWINPLNGVSWDNHPCKSWQHFINRV